MECLGELRSVGIRHGWGYLTSLLELVRPMSFVGNLTIEQKVQSCNANYEGVSANHDGVSYTVVFNPRC